MDILFVVLGLIVLDIAAFLWGIDSREGVNSTEWQRMAAWPAA